MIDVFLCFDTEDVINPEADDAALRLARSLTDAGLRGCFFTVGEKARVLRERGRRDVIGALAEHEVDYHGNLWFEFPEAAMAYGERLPWDQAVDHATRIELSGLHDVAEILGQWPAAWCQHQNNVNAMMPHVMRRLGVKVFNGGYASGPLRGWLMDQVTLTRHTHRISSQGSWQHHEIDPLQPEPPATVMDPVAELRAFQEQFDRTAEQHSMVMTLGHPTCWVMADWWGWYDWDESCHAVPPSPYARGRRWRPGVRRSRADSEAHFAWWDQLCRWLAARSDVRVTTFGEYANRVAEPGLCWLTLDEVDAVAAATLDGPTHLPVAGTTPSAVDALGVLAHLFAHIVRQGRVPDLVPVQRLLGPVEAPWPAQRTELTRSALFVLAGQLYDSLVEQRRVPGAIRGVVDLGPAAASMALARAWTHWRTVGQWPESVTVDPPGDLPAAGALPFFGQPSASSTHAPAGCVVTRLPDQVRWQSWSYREFVGATD